MAPNRATLIDVAKEAGVSRATASLVIRNSPLVADVTRARVEAAITSLGYVRNLTAARLRANQSRIIGVIVPNLTNPFFAEFLAGIETVINAAGLAVLLANSHDEPAQQLDVIMRMREHGVDGLLICPAEGTIVGTLSESQLMMTPVVQVLRHIRADLDYVGPDYVEGMGAAVDHLVNLGHRIIAFAGYSSGHSASTERMIGFRNAMTKHGLDADIFVPVPARLADIPDLAGTILKRSPTPTATICFNDLVAFGLCAGFADAGLTVGKEHAVIGFDDVMVPEIFRPKLTSVSTSPGMLGQIAAKRMLDRLADKRGESMALIFPTRLTLRETTLGKP